MKSVEAEQAKETFKYMSSKIKSSGKEQVVSKLGRKYRLQTLIKTRKKSPENYRQAFYDHVK